MTVFEAFPNAIVEWNIAKAKFSTITGNTVNTSMVTTLNVIIDAGESTEPNKSPNAAAINSDTLIYCKPEELPTLDVSELCASYIVGPSHTDKAYAIIDAGIGKNQETGVIEHVELKVRQTGVARWLES